MNYMNPLNGKKIAIIEVPNRKNKVLCIFEEPNVWIAVATFKSDEYALLFEDYFSKFIEGETE